MTDKTDPPDSTRLSITGDDRTRVAGSRAGAFGPAGNAGSRSFDPFSSPDPAARFGTAGGTSGGSEATGGQSLLLLPGMLLNNTQRVEALIGRGGMGEVYRATNIHTGDRDAIKVIRPDLVSEPQVRELFRREAAALRKVRHPAVVSYEGVFGDEAGRLFLVMEFVDGPSLASIIANAPLTPAEVRRVGVQIAEGLAAAHGCGVAHRDLSPDNIVLRDGNLDNAVLIDFGVAKRLDGVSTVVGSGFAGKLDYCSPEQCGLFDAAVDHRTDIYSLGLVLAAAAVGRPLPMGSSLARAVKARETQPDLSSVPDELRADLRRLLEPDPTRRVQSMRDVAALLSRDKPHRVAASAPTPAPGGRGRRHLTWIAGGAAALLLVGAGAVIALQFTGPPSDAVSVTTNAGPDRARPSEEEQRRSADAARQRAEEEQRAAEARRLEAERAAQDAQRKADEEARAAEEARRRTEDEARRQEAARAAEDARRRAEDEARRQEAARAADEARRRAEDEARRQEAARVAAEQRRVQEEARHRAEEEQRRRAAQQPAPPVAPPPARPAPPPQQQASRPAAAATVDGAWHGRICFRRLQLTVGNETCGPLSMSVTGGAAKGTWVINTVTYGVSGTVDSSGGRFTLDMPPTGARGGSALGTTFTLGVKLNGAALQGQGVTRSDVLVMFSAEH
ncbi:MAG: serine/threonine protein kinase [Alphaproteobacteria bacterium]|nr:serine/threonine protein kinase [Alphaproteobacteria bacterium]